MAHNVLIHSNIMDVNPRKALFYEAKDKLSESELFLIYPALTYSTKLTDDLPCASPFLLTLAFAAIEYKGTHEVFNK